MCDRPTHEMLRLSVRLWGTFGKWELLCPCLAGRREVRERDFDGLGGGRAPEARAQKAVSRSVGERALEKGADGHVHVSHRVHLPLGIDRASGDGAPVARERTVEERWPRWKVSDAGLASRCFCACDAHAPKLQAQFPGRRPFAACRIDGGEARLCAAGGSE